MITLREFITYLERYDQEREITVSSPGLRLGAESIEELKEAFSDNPAYTYHIHIFRTRKSFSSIN